MAGPAARPAAPALCVGGSSHQLKRTCCCGWWLCCQSSAVTQGGSSQGPCGGLPAAQLAGRDPEVLRCAGLPGAVSEGKGLQQMGFPWGCCSASSHFWGEEAAANLTANTNELGFVAFCVGVFYFSVLCVQLEQ